MKTEYAYLALAIFAEVIATTALKSSQQFTRLWPSLIVVAGYATAFWCLSLCLRSIPVGVVYAIWSGVGIVAIALLGYLIHGERLDLPALWGIGLILIGVMVIQLFSRSQSH